MACCDITDKNIHGFRSGFTRNYSKYIQIQVTVILSYRQAAGELSLTCTILTLYNSNSFFRDIVCQKLSLEQTIKKCIRLYVSVFFIELKVLNSSKDALESVSSKSLPRL